MSEPRHTARMTGIAISEQIWKRYAQIPGGTIVLTREQLARACAYAAEEAIERTLIDIGVAEQAVNKILQGHKL